MYELKNNSKRAVKLSWADRNGTFRSVEVQPGESGILSDTQYDAISSGDAGRALLAELEHVSTQDVTVNPDGSPRVLPHLAGSELADSAPGRAPFDMRREVDLRRDDLLADPNATAPGADPTLPVPRQPGQPPAPARGVPPPGSKPR